MNNMTEQSEKFFAYLMKRPCTRKQAHEFLTRQKIHEDAIENLMNEAESSGLIDDLTFAKLFAEGHLSWGNLRITYELEVKGISREDIDAALDDVEDEVSRAIELAESWKRTNIEARKIRTRLMSRGFTNRAIHSAIHGI